MEESSNKDLTLEEVKQRKSIRLVQAQFLESTGQSSEAEKAYTETAQDEEWIVKELKRTGRSSTDFVANLISAASCWKKSGNYDRAFELIDEVLQAADVEPQWKQEGLRLRDEWRQYLPVPPPPIHHEERTIQKGSNDPISPQRPPSLFPRVPDYPTKDAFDMLLNWLEPERETAGEKFTAIRQRLISMFVQRGFSDAEDLADETIVRVLEKVSQITSTYHGNPALYFFAVGRRVMFESARQRMKSVSVEDISNELLVSDKLSRSESNLELQYFEHCLNRLQQEKRDLLAAYYYEQSDKRRRIEQREELAQRLGISLNGLRLRINQIRNELRKCMKERYEGETSK